MPIIAIGNDRCAIDYKKQLIEYLIKNEYQVIDCGSNLDKPVDYPIYGERVGELVATGKCDYGVVLCGTGIGIGIAANKVKGIRCGVAYSDEVTKLMREHNNANVIAFGRKFMTYEDVQRRLGIFLQTKFIGDYHQMRVNQLAQIESGEELHTDFPEKFDVNIISAL